MNQGPDAPSSAEDPLSAATGSTPEQARSDPLSPDLSAADQALQARLSRLEARLLLDARLGEVERDFARRAVAEKGETESLQPAKNKKENPNSGMWALGLGLFFFGGALGLIAGMSEVAGISEKLLTSVLSFVTGGLLSYSGFRYVRRGEKTTEVDPRRVGLGIGGFSLGLMIFALAGVYLRTEGIDLPLDQPAVAAAKKVAGSTPGLNKKRSGTKATLGGAGAPLIPPRKKNVTMAMRGRCDCDELGLADKTRDLASLFRNGSAESDVAKRCETQWKAAADLAAVCRDVYEAKHDPLLNDVSWLRDARVLAEVALWSEVDAETQAEDREKLTSIRQRLSGVGGKDETK